jgi:hypothetical protein
MSDAIEGVAAGASARVGEILSEAERQGRVQHSEAEKAAAAELSDARVEAERLLAEAREEARREARDRSDHLAAIQAKLASRGPAVLEGLEGAEATRARLEALIEALAAAGERLMAAVDEPAGTDGGDPDLVETESLPDESRNPAEEAVSDAIVVDDPVEDADDSVTTAADEVEEADEAIETPADEDADADSGSDGPVVLADSGSNGSSASGRRNSARYDGPLPEGAPMVRKPKRTPERDARFAALVLALQGRERDDVEEHLRSEHEFGDCGPILDEVFGRA